MRIVATSDFHGRQPPHGFIPECDLLLIAGDVLGGDLDDFGEWLACQPAREIIGVAGNHDYVARSHPDRVRRLPWTYLCNEAAVVAGLKVFGSPLSMPFNDWAFMAPEGELAAVWATIPDDTEVLVVHGPAKRILDRAGRGVDTGSETLRARIAELPQLRLLVTGHIHEAYGEAKVPVGDSGLDEMRWLHCVNPSYVDAGYQPGNPAIVIDIEKEAA